MAGQGATKKTRGRQKIEIKRIEGNEPRLVTFSKRKAGIFKKATEISNLCDAEVGIVIFSPAGKAFAFGSPSIEQVTDRFLNKVGLPADQISRIIETRRKMRLDNLSNRHNELKEQLHAAKYKNMFLKRIAEVVQRGNMVNNVEPLWWEVAIDETSYGQFAKMNQFYESLCNYLAEH